LPTDSQDMILMKRTPANWHVNKGLPKNAQPVRDTEKTKLRNAAINKKNTLVYQ